MAEFEKIGERSGCLKLRRNAIPVYILDNGAWVIMDSGTARDREELLEFLRREHVRIRAVLTSHGHSDHIGNHNVLQEQFGAELIMTAFDGGMTESFVGLKTYFYSSTTDQLRQMLPEMNVRADRIILPGEKTVRIEEAIFSVIPLPGHAHSHVGFRMPGGETYLADALQCRSILEKEKLFYMLSWKESLETVSRLAQNGQGLCLLSHYGPVENIRREAALALEMYERMLSEEEARIRDGASLEEITAEAVNRFRISTDRKIRLTERILRSVTEYLVDTGRLKTYTEDGIIRYERNREKDRRD